MASTYLKRTYGSTTNRRTYTWSIWLKRCNIGVEQNILSAGNFSGSPYLDARFNTDHTLEWYEYSSGYNFRLVTNRVFRDPNCWYNIIFAVDTTQGTDTNRVKIYVNGVQETSFSTATYPSQNLDTSVNYSGYKTSIGSLRDNATFNGLMSHVYFIDGTQCLPTVFGETDATTGEWKIKTSPTVTMGTNGFSVLKDGNTITDQSSNSNDLSVGGGTLTKTEDNPSNVFATYNPANVWRSAGHDISHGNTVGTNNTGQWYWRPTTLAATAGKFYAELKVISGSIHVTGIADLDDCYPYAPVDSHFGKPAVTPNGRGFAWYGDDGKVYYNNTSTAVFGTYGTGDFLSFAMDLDNGAFYIGKNGTWLNSGDPTSGASKTGAVNTWTGGGTWCFADAIANNGELAWNWGNGYFKTTAVSSAGTNASNIGIFEYDVPTGYTALSTKGLNL